MYVVIYSNMESNREFKLKYDSSQDRGEDSSNFVHSRAESDHSVPGGCGEQLDGVRVIHSQDTSDEKLADN